MSTLVMKLGGSAIGTMSALQKVLEVVLAEHKRWHRLVLVVSALEGVTDSLLQASQRSLLGQQRESQRRLGSIRARHLQIIDSMDLSKSEHDALVADIDRLLFDTSALFQSLEKSQAVRGSIAYLRQVDAILAVGEKLAARILAALLRQYEVKSVAMDTTALIVTDDSFGSATPLLDRTREQVILNLKPLLDRSILPVVTGFIGATEDGYPTTLGRGGSDYTASLLGTALSATEIWIWTDVDGMMTADPHVVPDARVIGELTYRETAAMAHFGARVLHTRMIAPIQAEHIPLRIKSILHPDAAGSLVTESTSHQRLFKAVTALEGILCTSNRGAGDISSHTLLETAYRLSIPLDLLLASQDATSSLVCFLIPTIAGPDAIPTVIAEFAAQQQTTSDAGIWHMQVVGIVTCICEENQDMTIAAAQAMQALISFPVYSMTSSSASCSISFIVPQEAVTETILRLHDRFISIG